MRIAVGSALTQITLMDFATVVVRSLVTSPSPHGTVVKGLTLALNPDGNPKSTSKRFHWLPAAAPSALCGGELTPVVLVKYPCPSVSSTAGGADERTSSVQRCGHLPSPRHRSAR